MVEALVFRAPFIQELAEIFKRLSINWSDRTFIDNFDGYEKVTYLWLERNILYTFTLRSGETEERLIDFAKEEGINITIGRFYPKGSIGALLSGKVEECFSEEYIVRWVHEQHTC